jgi:hypothetical protein
MSEGEVIEQLVEFTAILLAGVSVLFTVVSAYVVALNYFIGEANLLARALTFVFVSLILGMLVFVMMGAQVTQIGLVDRLVELEQAGELTAAGHAALANARPENGFDIMGQRSIDDIVRLCIWSGLGFIYIALAYLTFVHRWRPDVYRVALQKQGMP